jgi:hypothetical protein
MELGFLPLESLIVEQASKPLRGIAQSMYDLARSYGNQADDQTVLLIRRRLSSALPENSCSEYTVGTSF